MSYINSTTVDANGAIEHVQSVSANKTNHKIQTATNEEAKFRTDVVKALQGLTKRVDDLETSLTKQRARQFEKEIERLRILHKVARG